MAAAALLAPLALLVELLDELLPHAATMVAATAAIAATRPWAAKRLKLEYIEIDLSLVI